MISYIATLVKSQNCFSLLDNIKNILYTLEHFQAKVVVEIKSWNCSSKEATRKVVLNVI